MVTKLWTLCFTANEGFQDFHGLHMLDRAYFLILCYDQLMFVWTGECMENPLGVVFFRLASISSRWYAHLPQPFQDHTKMERLSYKPIGISYHKLPSEIQGEKFIPRARKHSLHSSLSCPDLISFSLISLL